MSTRLGRRFRELVEREGLRGALARVAGFVRATLDPTSRQNRLRYRRVRAGGSTVVRDVQGSQMALEIPPVTADPTEETLALEGVREPASTSRFREVLESRKRRTEAPIRVFDVGAHTGYFALLEARVLGERGRVFALEPAARNAELLRRNVELNGYANVEVVEAAAGAEPGAGTLCLKSRESASRMPEALAGGGYEDTVEVPVTTIDELLDERTVPADAPVVVRMDVEGYEGYAFDGMTGLLASDRTVTVFVEIHDREYDPKGTVLNALEAHGFDLIAASYDGGDTVTVPDGYDEVPDGNKIHVFARRE